MSVERRIEFLQEEIGKMQAEVADLIGTRPSQRDQLQELYRKFDGPEPGGNTRLAWYGQCRAKEMSHNEAILDTAKQYKGWVLEVWPKRGIPLPETV